MKTEKNILFAFALNLLFAVFEFFGGIYTGSIAIVSDAVHDLGDAASIGISYLFEKKSKRSPDAVYSYGYARYSVLGSIFTTLLLMIGSIVVIRNAVGRMIDPTVINYNGMILFAVVGVIVNFCAAAATHGEGTLNQRAVNLHMLEDVLGWLVVLVGAVVMRFTDFVLLDPILSVGVAVFILVNAIRNLREAIDLFLEKTPHGISIEEICEHILELDGVLDVHHIHIWSLDGQLHYATMHVVTNTVSSQIKEKIREELLEHGIVHATLELESADEDCHAKTCRVESAVSCGHHHHHHH